MLALGIVIVYRANRIVNFAAADLGRGAGDPRAPALSRRSAGTSTSRPASASAARSCSASLVEFLFLRRFFKAPRLDPHRRDDRRHRRSSSRSGCCSRSWIGEPRRRAVPAVHRPALHGRQRLNGTTSSATTCSCSSSCRSSSSGSPSFFRFSAIGVALRATAENADRASLLGIPVRRLQSVVWGLVGAARVHRDVPAHRCRRTVARPGARSDAAAQRAGRGGDRAHGTAADRDAARRSASASSSQAARFHYASDAYRSAIVIAADHRDRAARAARRHALAGSRARRRRRGRRRARSGRSRPSCAASRAVRIARWVLGVLLVARPRARSRCSCPSDRVQARDRDRRSTR